MADELSLLEKLRKYQSLTPNMSHPDDVSAVEAPIVPSNPITSETITTTTKSAPRIATPKFDMREEESAALLQQIEDMRKRSDSQLEEARREADRQDAISTILGGLNKVGGGIASSGAGSQVAVDNSYLDDMTKSAQGKVVRTKEDREQKLKDLLYDYNRLRESVKDKTSLQDKEFENSLKLAQLNQSSLTNSLKRQEMDAFKQARLDLAREKFEKSKNLSDKQVEAISAIDNALTGLADVRKDKPGIDTGPLSAVWNNALGDTPLASKDFIKFQSGVLAVATERIKELSGLAVTDEEAKRLIAMLPSASDNDTKFNAKLDSVMEDLEKKRKVYLKNMGLQGKNVKQFEAAPPTSSSEETVSIIKPDGRRARIPKSKLKDALEVTGTKLAE